MSIKVIADSTCDLPPELLDRYDITLLPLSINKDGRFYKDGVEITLGDIFAYVDAGGALCSTAAVNLQEFTDCFERYCSGYDEIVCVTISSEMSSCYQNACLAAESFPNVYVVDSRNLSSAKACSRSMPRVWRKRDIRAKKTRLCCARRPGRCSPAFSSISLII